MTIKHMVTGAVAISLLTGCASREQQTAALDAWRDCIRTAVKRYDDGRTDPVSLAYGIAPNCASLYNEFGSTMMSGMITDKGQDAMRERVRASELRMITNAILENRAANRNPAKGTGS